MILKIEQRGNGYMCEVRCDNCGKVFNRSLGHFTRERAKYKHYCSRKCFGLQRRGPKHFWWKGGKIVHTQGYITVNNREHPNADSKGYVMEHRLIMEEKIGRLLTKKDVVHHLNGIKDDNRPENLALVTIHSHDTQSYIKQLQERIRELEAQLGK